MRFAAQIRWQYVLADQKRGIVGFYRHAGGRGTPPSSADFGRVAYLNMETWLCHRPTKSPHNIKKENLIFPKGRSELYSGYSHGRSEVIHWKILLYY